MTEDAQSLKQRIRGRLADWIIDDWISDKLADGDFGNGIDELLDHEFSESRAWIDFREEEGGLVFELTVGVNWSDRPPIKMSVCICENAVQPLRKLLGDVQPDECVWLNRSGEPKESVDG